MIAFFSRIIERIQSRRRKAPYQVSKQTLQALRQLNQRYQRQKRLWVYIILSAMALLVLYVMFSVFWAGLRAQAIPIAWIILAGIFIASFQVRRCNELIATLRQAHQVQFQIEKAQADRAAKEKVQEAEQDQEKPQVDTEGHRPISSNGSQRPSDLPDIQP